MPAANEPALAEVADGVVRLTWRIPLGIDHVHCYAVRVDGGWMVVDTGLGLGDGPAVWRSTLARLGGETRTIVVTHSHPDHVGGAADVAAATGAPVLQGRIDHGYCLRTWGDESALPRFASYLRRHGAPPGETQQIIESTRVLRPRVHFARDPQLLEEGDLVHGWRVLELPGHADGHVCLLKDGVLLAGDAILEPITPTVGLFPETAPDPLGRYQASLRRIEEIAPRVAFAGHGRPIADPARRAAEILLHHEERLEATLRALVSSGRTAWEVSFELFPGVLPPPQRRFAVVEALAHLERLVVTGAVERIEGDEQVTYVAARLLSAD